MVVGVLSMSIVSIHVWFERLTDECKILYKFELGYNTVETTKNICHPKVQLITVL